MRAFHWVGLILATAGCVASERVVVRVGHFPNITHAQGVIGHHKSRVGSGWFEQRLGSNVIVQWYVFNAGPSSMEGILAGSIDLTYVGPNPAINAHLRSGGKEVRIVAGACSGGAALVVQSDERIKVDGDLKGKRIGTPQLGNTQDVAARAYLLSKGLKVTLTGGDARVLPTPNPDQLTLFKRGDLDGVWTVEPWVSRLIQEAGGRLYLEERDLWPQTEGRYVTTHLVCSARFLKEQPGLLRQWIAAHHELTEWIRGNPDEAMSMVNAELKAETTMALPDELMREAWGRLEFTCDPIRASLLKSAEDAHRLGFLNRPPDLSHIYQLDMLNDVMKAAK
jgi:NitT/TauT family transport system substrate-binding protein